MYSMTWSLGVLIGVPAAVICLVFGFVALGIFAKWQREDHDALPLVGGAVAFILVVIGICASPVVGFYPYSAEYHQWRDHGGVVAKIDNRLISTGKAMETKFVVRFEGSTQQYGCDDTRCASVQVGDRLTLSCKRAWQYTGTDGYDCRFVSTEPVA